MFSLEFSNFEFTKATTTSTEAIIRTIIIINLFPVDSKRQRDFRNFGRHEEEIISEKSDKN